MAQQMLSSNATANAATANATANDAQQMQEQTQKEKCNKKQQQQTTTKSIYLILTFMERGPLHREPSETSSDAVL
jgi:hypothetical protein